MEATTPEQFWVGRSTCSNTNQDENRTIQNPTLTSCAQAISTVKTVAIAQSQWQRVYTINP
jgi:hypothetical protein